MVGPLDAPASCLLLTELFERQVAHAPDAIALTCDALALSYGRLNAKANALAHQLIRRGLGPEDHVAVACGRSIETVVSVLAVLKAGAVYVPVDVAAPVSRIDALLRRTSAVALLTTTPARDALSSRWDEHATIVVCDSDARPEAALNPTDAERRLPLRRSNAAYIIHTSGSTGAPKGVVIEHGALMAFCDGIRERVPFTASDRHLALTTPAFDISIFEFVVPLCYGAHVIVATDRDVHDPSRARQLMQRHQATSVQATPTYWASLLEDCAAPPRLRALTGGEALAPKLAHALCRNAATVMNLYGPTETTIWSTVSLVTDSYVGDSEEAVSIGGALDGYRVYVLDHRLHEVASGESGELWIAGDSLARGYWQQPGVTAQRFVADVYGPPGRRMYRTGDLARRLGNGQLEFMGRVDDQLKLRGFRIEPREIEVALECLDSIGRAAVVLEKGDNDRSRLVAYVTRATSAPLSVRAIRHLLRERLPDYMVPSTIREAAEFPQTPSGKLDRFELIRRHHLTAQASEGSQCRTAMQQELCDLFADVLDLDAVNVDDDFFELGGHSIAAMQLINRLRLAYDLELDVETLLRAPTAAELAALIESEDATAAPEERATVEDERA